MELVKYEKLNDKLPLKAYPKDGELLNSIIINVFVEWLSGLLTLSSQTSAERLEIALPAIKEHCWSMGFDEIKKMFEMYADNKLNITPIPNYFDRILFGKIVSAYKEQKKVEPKKIKMPEPTQEEKDAMTYMGVVNCFDEFKQTNEILDGYTWVYDHLDHLKIIKYSDSEKRKMMPIARERLIAVKKNTLNIDKYKSFMADMEGKRKEGAIIVQAKKMLLERFFSSLVAKNKHIKDLL